MKMFYKLNLFFSLMIISQVNAQWEEINNGIFGSPIYAISNKEDTVYAGMKDGIHISKDIGKSWTNFYDIDTTFWYNSVHTLAFKGDKIFIGIWGGGGVRHNDHDYKLDTINTTLSQSNVSALLFVGDTLFAGTNAGCFVSSNSGKKWILKNTGLNDIEIFSLAIKDNQLYAGTNNGVYISNDFGEHWTYKSTNIINTSVYCIGFYGNNVIACTKGGGVYVSKDNGETWFAKNYMLPNLSITALYINNNSIYIGTEYGVYYSNDGCNSWQRRNVGIKEDLIFSLSGNGKNIWAGTQKRGIYLSTDNGITWNNSGLNSLKCLEIASNDNYVFVRTLDNKIFRTANLGISWEEIKSTSDMKHIFSIVSKQNDIYIGTQKGVYFSKDNANNWESGGLEDKSIHSLTIYNNDIFVNTNDGIFLKRSYLWEDIGLKGKYFNKISINNNLIFASESILPYYYSTDYGKKWITYDSAGKNSNSYWINDCEIDNDNIYIGSGYNSIGFSGVSCSTDLGKSWKDKGMIGDGIYCLDFKNPNWFAGGNDFQVYFSTDKGNNWDNFAIKQSGFVIGSSVYDLKQKSDYIIAATNGDGMFRRKLSDFGINDVKDNSTNTHLTFFPNPVNDILNIKLNCNPPTNEEIEIYDLMGQNLLSQKIDNIQTKINIQNISTGIYYCRLKQNRTVFKFEVIR